MKALTIPLVALATISCVASSLLGGRQPIDVKNSEVQHAAKLASELMQNNNKNVGLNLVHIKSAEYKIIAGIEYYLTLSVNIGEKLEECHITVTKLVYEDWSVSTDDSDPCTEYVNKPDSPNEGKETLDLDEPAVQEAANWAVNRINSMSNNMFRQVLEKIAFGSRQEVGHKHKYKFLLHLVPTDCFNSPEMFDKGLEDCPPSQDNTMHEQCDVSVYYLDGKYDMEDFKCSPLKDLLGGDDHDNRTHKVRNILGADDQDLKPHGSQLLGGDDHDLKPHSSQLLGGDDHDLRPHNSQLLGGDDHDLRPHYRELDFSHDDEDEQDNEDDDTIRKLLGGDDHDLKPHSSQLLGGDDHDLKPHDSQLLGGDDHDLRPHYSHLDLFDDDEDEQDNEDDDTIRKLLGGDDHDLKLHGDFDEFDYRAQAKIKALIGGDNHDFMSHDKLKSFGELNAASEEDVQKKMLHFGSDVLHQSANDVKKMNILGGDDHDYQPHKKDLCHEHQKAFEDFKGRHERLYASKEEEDNRFQIFCTNMNRVKLYQKIEQGTAVYGATQFADISEEEFKQKYLGLKANLKYDSVQWPSAKIPKGPIPDAWDWRDHNAVTSVKNQGSCGSCWAFSTTGNVEGVNAIKHKKLVSLSEQELVDCDKVDEGCQGGLPSQAYLAIMNLGGLETEKDYSYEGAREACHFNKSEVAVKVTGALNISQNEDEMAAWLYHNGPISIGINAFAMQFYFGGIAHPWRIFCNPSSLDHGVLIVGYGKEGDEPYWIIKNSWGPHWGRKGYYYVYRGEGVCGLNRICTSAVVA